MAGRDGLLRVRDGTNAAVAPIELFFDLVALAVRDTVVTRRPGYRHGRALNG